ncbi:hypothetical protein CLV78_11427 [Aliiruegeria haliotis]|uniref:Uncharacterized protein n=1 Tax=Aliiruegeria haliotis TaxID=1280846 RepID=A0A2T0RGI5_9RHOB|nr:hypothetical protein [Aliiruegeria haliotis]PRY20242.1 hypothetical protein CLV78_11427 [Aliiruegeria haliotis]
MPNDPTHLTGQPFLFIDAQHGLCNRLRAMASAASIAEATGRELVVIWRPDHHCDCLIHDLLDYRGLVVSEDKPADVFREGAWRVYNYMEIEPGAAFQAPILADDDAEPGGDVYIRSAYTLNSPYQDFSVEDRFLDDLVAAEPVMELVNRVRHPSSVAAHIRTATGPAFDHLSFEAPGNWPPERHQELVECRQKSDAERFVQRLDTLVAEGQADSIFLAADLPSTYQRFYQHFGDRVTSLRRTDFDRSTVQLQYAMADLLLLTSADRFLGSYGSSFTDVAQRLALPGRAFEKCGVDF